MLINVPSSASLVGQFYMVPQKLLARLKHHIPNVICIPTWDSVSATVWTVSESVVTLDRLRHWGSNNEYMKCWLTGSLWTSEIHSNGSHEDHRIVCQRKRTISLLTNLLQCPGSQGSSLEAFKETLFSSCSVKLLKIKGGVQYKENRHIRESESGSPEIIQVNTKTDKNNNR